MKIMKEINGDQLYLLSETGYGMARHFDGLSVVSSTKCTYIDALRDSLHPCDEEDHCLVLSQPLSFEKGLDCMRGESLQQHKDSLRDIIWENETRNRGIPRFTFEQVQEFCDSLTIGNGGWIMPPYLPNDTFTNNPDSATILRAFLSGKNLVKYVSAIKFYSIKYFMPHLTSVLEHIFERLDYKWNKNIDRISIAYPHKKREDYQNVFSILGYDLLTENLINSETLLAQYIKTESE